MPFFQEFLMPPGTLLSEQMTKIYDISLPISMKMPVWPGDPKVTVRQVASLEKGDEANISQIRMSVHTGTHIDAPRHFFDNGKTVDQIPLEKLIGEVLVVDVGEGVSVISDAVLKQCAQFNDLETASKVLFKTKNSNFWKEAPAYFHQDFVGIDTSGAEFLADLNLDLIGVDYLSIAPFTDTDRPHQILLKKEILLLEGINLADVPAGRYNLYCLPLNIEQCEGAPARVILTSR